MARFTLNFSTDNAAFDDFAEREIANILRNVAERFTNGQVEGSIQDHNGNTVGSFKLSEARHY